LRVGQLLTPDQDQFPCVSVTSPRCSERTGKECAGLANLLQTGHQMCRAESPWLLGPPFNIPSEPVLSAQSPGHSKILSFSFSFRCSFVVLVRPFEKQLSFHVHNKIVPNIHHVRSFTTTVRCQARGTYLIELGRWRRTYHITKQKKGKTY
jgi:hypothetical protein